MKTKAQFSEYMGIEVSEEDYQTYITGKAPKKSKIKTRQQLSDFIGLEVSKEDYDTYRTGKTTEERVGRDIGIDISKGESLPLSYAVKYWETNIKASKKRLKKASDEEKFGIETEITKAEYWLGKAKKSEKERYQSYLVSLRPVDTSFSMKVSLSGLMKSAYDEIKYVFKDIASLRF